MLGLFLCLAPTLLSSLPPSPSPSLPLSSANWRQVAPDASPGYCNLGGEICCLPSCGWLFIKCRRGVGVEGVGGRGWQNMQQGKWASKTASQKGNKSPPSPLIRWEGDPADRGTKWPWDLTISVDVGEVGLRGVHKSGTVVTYSPIITLSFPTWST